MIKICQYCVSYDYTRDMCDLYDVPVTKNTKACARFYIGEFGKFFLRNRKF